MSNHFSRHELINPDRRDAGPSASSNRPQHLSIAPMHSSTSRLSIISHSRTDVSSIHSNTPSPSPARPTHAHRAVRTNASSIHLPSNLSRLMEIDHLQNITGIDAHTQGSSSRWDTASNCSRNSIRSYTTEEFDDRQALENSLANLPWATPPPRAISESGHSTHLIPEDQISIHTNYILEPPHLTYPFLLSDPAIVSPNRSSRRISTTSTTSQSFLALPSPVSLAPPSPAHRSGVRSPSPLVPPSRIADRRLSAQTGRSGHSGYSFGSGMADINEGTSQDRHRGESSSTRVSDSQKARGKEKEKLETGQQDHFAVTGSPQVTSRSSNIQGRPSNGEQAQSTDIEARSIIKENEIEKGLGRNKSVRSTKSFKSFKTSRSKRMSNNTIRSDRFHPHHLAWEVNRDRTINEQEMKHLISEKGEDWRDREASLELGSLLGRAMFLEKILGAGKRVSAPSIRPGLSRRSSIRPKLNRESSSSSAITTRKRVYPSTARWSNSTRSRSIKRSMGSIRRELSKKVKRTESRDDEFTEISDGDSRVEMSSVNFSLRHEDHIRPDKSNKGKDMVSAVIFLTTEEDMNPPLLPDKDVGFVRDGSIGNGRNISGFSNLISSIGQKTRKIENGMRSTSTNEEKSKSSNTERKTENERSESDPGELDSYQRQSPHLGHRSPNHRNRQSVISYISTGRWSGQEGRKKKRFWIWLVVGSCVLGVLGGIGITVGVILGSRGGR